MTEAGSLIFAARATASDNPRAEAMTSARGTSRAAAPLPWTVLGVAAVALVLAVLPGRRDIPPLVESDYCYLLTAADRFIAGKGLTTTTPVAPLQPWTWKIGRAHV